MMPGARRRTLVNRISVTVCYEVLVRSVLRQRRQRLQRPLVRRRRELDLSQGGAEALT